jgi:hypothetical protein
MVKSFPRLYSNFLSYILKVNVRLVFILDSCYLISDLIPLLCVRLFDGVKSAH